MSLVAIAKSSVIAALGASHYNLNYLTTSQEALVANHHLAKSDAFYQHGDMKAAISEFYSAFSPTAEDCEKQIVTEYMDKLMAKSVHHYHHLKRDEESHSQGYIHCMAFGVCADEADAPDGEKVQGRDFKLRGSKEAQSDSIQKRAATFPWVFSPQNQVNVQFIKDLANAFATLHFGRYLEGGGSRSFCYHGACLSWHHDIQPFRYTTAETIVKDLLEASNGAVLISARTVANQYPRAAQFFCVSARPTGC